MRILFPTKRPAKRHIPGKLKSILPFKTFRIQVKNRHSWLPELLGVHQLSARSSTYSTPLSPSQKFMTNFQQNSHRKGRKRSRDSPLSLNRYILQIVTAYLMAPAMGEANTTSLTTLTSLQTLHFNYPIKFLFSCNY